jgi:hypothetical protein
MKVFIVVSTCAGSDLPFFNRAALVRVEGDELERDRESSLKRMLFAEFLLEGVVEVDAACLELGAQRVVDAVRRLVLDLVPDGEKELEVLDGACRQRAFGMPQTEAQLPVQLRSAFRSLDHVLLFMAIVDTLALEPGMHKVCPREELAAEHKSEAVERVDCRDHRLTGLD